MSLALDRFYLIVDSAEWVRRLVPLGVKLLQLRIKDRPESDIREEVRQAKAVCDAHRAQLVVNDYWRIAIEENCDFIHLGQGDLDSADLQACRNAGLRIGISTHDNAELDLALAAKPDYVALGPIYPTLLKQMPWASQGLERICEWKRRIGDIPLVAIGGLTIERLPGVFGAGADCAAVVTDIARHPDPEARTRQWIDVARVPA